MSQPSFKSNSFGNYQFGTVKHEIEIPQYVNKPQPLHYECQNKECFDCERITLQALPENANWKTKIQRASSFDDSSAAMQGNWICLENGGSFSLDSLIQLKPADFENSKPLCIFDDQIGRKRRHDPWFSFANHQPTNMNKKKKKFLKSASLPKIGKQRQINQQCALKKSEVWLNRSSNQMNYSNDLYSMAISPLSSPGMSSCSDIPQSSSPFLSDSDYLNNDSNSCTINLESIEPFINVNEIKIENSFLDLQTTKDQIFEAGRGSDNCNLRADEYDWLGMLT